MFFVEPIHIKLELVGMLERELIGTSLLADIKSHSEDPDNRKRFELWLAEHQKENERQIKSGA